MQPFSIKTVYISHSNNAAHQHKQHDTINQFILKKEIDSKENFIFNTFISTTILLYYIIIIL